MEHLLYEFILYLFMVNNIQNEMQFLSVVNVRHFSIFTQSLRSRMNLEKNMVVKKLDIWIKDMIRVCVGNMENAC